VKRLSLAIIRELGGEYSFDVLRISGEDTSTTSWCAFDSITFSLWGGVEAVPDFEVLMVDGAADRFGDEVDICEQLNM